MNSRERVMRTIQHKETDRIPSFYLGENNVTVPLGNRLGIKADDFSYVTPAHMQLDERLGCDGRRIRRRSNAFFYRGHAHCKRHRRL